MGPPGLISASCHCKTGARVHRQCYENAPKSHLGIRVLEAETAFGHSCFGSGKLTVAVQEGTRNSQLGHAGASIEDRRKKKNTSHICVVVVDASTQDCFCNRKIKKLQKTKNQQVFYKA